MPLVLRAVGSHKSPLAWVCVLGGGAGRVMGGARGCARSPPCWPGPPGHRGVGLPHLLVPRPLPESPAASAPFGSRRQERPPQSLGPRDRGPPCFPWPGCLPRGERVGSPWAGGPGGRAPPAYSLTAGGERGCGRGDSTAGGPGGFERSPGRASVGRRGVPRGPCPDAVWGADRPSRANPPELRGTRVPVPCPRRPHPPPPDGSGARVVGCSWSQALPSRGGPSAVGGLPWLLPALRGCPGRPFLRGQEGTPPMCGRPRGVETDGVGGGGRRWAGEVGRCPSARLEGRAGERVRDDPPDSRPARARRVSEETSARGCREPREGRRPPAAPSRGPREVGGRGCVPAGTGAVGPRPTWPVPGRVAGGRVCLRGRSAPAGGDGAPSAASPSSPLPPDGASALGAWVSHGSRVCVSNRVSFSRGS